MAKALDDYNYCSPFLTVLSLDQLLSEPDENGVLFDVPDPGLGADDRLDRQRACDTLHYHIRLLPLRQQQVIQAIYLAGWTGTQTARHLGISDAAVAKLKAKALIRLLAELEPRRDDLLI